MRILRVHRSSLVTVPAAPPPCGALTRIMGHMSHAPDLAPGVITAADIYRELVDLRVRLAVIENQNTTAERVHSDHEIRLRSVERFRWILFGASTVIGSAAGVVSALVTARGHLPVP